MSGLVHFVAYVAFAATMVFLWGFLCLLFFPPGLFLVFGLMLAYFWFFFAYLAYLHMRQEEVLQVLTTAVECRAPMAPALWSYVAERPQGMERRFWVGTILFVLLPGYYWTFYRRHDFDRRVTQVAMYLEHGAPLFDALIETPGVVSRETLLAVSLGEATGDMARCLRVVARRREKTPWSDVLPRLLYPLVVALIISGIMLWWFATTGPKLEAIAKDLNVDITSRWTPLANAVRHFAVGSLFVATALGVAILVTIVILRGLPLWHLSRLYRMRTQSLVLNMLGLLLQTGRTLTSALEMLIDSRAFPWYVAHNIGKCRQLADQGMSLADSLASATLIPESCVPLVRSAERLQRVPWALEEIGTQLELRWFQRLQALSLWLSPVLLLLLSVVVGAFALLTIYPYVMFIDANIDF